MSKPFFPSESFDAVICFCVFPHPDHKESSDKHKQHGESGGKLVIAHTISSEELKVHHKKASKHVAHAVMPTKDEMTQLLKHTGFTQISIKDDPGCYLCTAHKA